MEDKQWLLDGAACLEAALDYLRMGWSVLSLCPPDHLGIDRVVHKHSKSCNSPGKRPWHTWADYQSRLPTEEEVRDWWKAVPNANVGMALGPVSGVIRIDIEGASGEAALAQMAAGDLPDTLEFSSGRVDGGRGLLYSISDGMTLKTTYEKPKANEEVRFQAKGAQTVLPPSRHKSGMLYRWTPDRGPHDGKISIAPAWLLAKLAEKQSAIKGRSSEEWENVFKGSSQGSRNDNMTAIIGKLLGSLADINRESDVTGVWLAVLAINERNDPPMEQEELKNTFISVLRAEKRKRESLDLAKLDALATDQIAESAQDPKDNGWHLVVVESEPEEYKLRCPLWADSPKLKNGYLVLTMSQLLNWTSNGDNIKKAAYKQARIIIPAKMPNWSSPGGHLEELTKTATTEKTSPESKRRLHILGYVYRYLITAREPNSNGDGKSHYPVSGRPTKTPEGSVIFKFPHLKKDIKNAKEDFGHREVTRLMEESGFAQRRIDGCRWWIASQDSLGELGIATEEGE